MKRMKWLTLLAIFGLIAAACSAAEEAADTATGAAEDAAEAVEEAVTDDDDGGDEAAEEEPAEEAPAEEDAGDGVAFDFGVTEDTIRVGLNADLSGVFAGLVSPIVDAQQAYFDRLNENGGIDGREVELVILDTAYDLSLIHI